MIDFLLKKRLGIKNNLPIVGPINENYWAFGDSYNKGAWILHTLRNAINDDDTNLKIVNELGTLLKIKNV